MARVAIPIDDDYMSALQAPTGRGVCRKADVDGRRLMAGTVNTQPIQEAVFQPRLCSPWQLFGKGTANRR